AEPDADANEETDQRAHGEDREGEEQDDIGRAAREERPVAEPEGAAEADAGADGTTRRLPEIARPLACLLVIEACRNELHHVRAGPESPIFVCQPSIRVDQLRLVQQPALAISPG